MSFRKGCIRGGWAKPGVSNSMFLVGEMFLAPFGTDRENLACPLEGCFHG